jgi:hypothetical protein
MKIVIAAFVLLALLAPPGSTTHGSPRTGAGRSSSGPAIIINQPRHGGVYQGPVPVDVKFSPGPGASIALSTLKIQYVKWAFTKDITEKVRTYVRDEGVFVPQAKLPRGKHTIRISLRDDRNNESRSMVSFEVR